MSQDDFESPFHLGRLSKSEKREIEGDFKKENFKKIKYGVVVIAVFQVFYLILDVRTGFFLVDSRNILNFVAECMIIAYSFIFLVLRRLLIKRDKVCSAGASFAFSMYHFVILIGFSLFLYTDMAVRGRMYGSYLSMLFLSCFAPFYHVFMVGLVYSLAMVFGFALNLICPSEGVISYLVQIAIMGISALIFRRYFMVNILYRKRANQSARHLNHQANTDFLTGIANRQCLYKDFEKNIRQSSSVSMIMYDIDNFKMYNDTFSHISGDDCLVRTTSAVNKFTKSHNGKMYRYGGEEFVLMFFNLQKNDFVNITRELCPVVYKMKIKHAHEAKLPFVSISAGAQFYKKQKIPLTQILSECDEKLYEAKGKGKNCCIL